MDENENTKDYSELNETSENNDEEIETEVEVINQTREELHPHKTRNTKKIILIVITVVLVIAALVCIIYLMKHKKDNNTNENVSKITRPSDDLEYTVLKQNYFGFNCKKTTSGDKIKKLAKGMKIECLFTYEINASQRLSELYFDVNNSANVKLDTIRNTSKAELINEDKTYKLTPETPSSVFDSGLSFIYEVLNDDESAYIEVSNIVFKDDTDKYFKVINSIETFPPEYDDKIFIYKTTYEDDDTIYYYSSKNKLEDMEVFDTFQCKNETCETKAESSHYFLILDDTLVVYDPIKKVTNTLKLPDDFEIKDYSFEIMNNPKGNIYGIAFKKNYQSGYECSNSDEICVNKGISGYEIGYYSLSANMFTIDPSLKIIGSSAYEDYDLALMLKKDDSFGVFSYEDDNMMLEFSNKYKSIDFDYYTASIMLEVYDKENKEYYFEYFDPVYSSYKLNTEYLKKFENANLYYTTQYNRDKKEVTMLFDSKGNPLKNLPYALSKNLTVTKDKIIVDRTLDYYVYDLNGTLLYRTGYNDSFILGYTKNYVIAKSEDNKLEILDTLGKIELYVRELNDNTTFVSAKEDGDNLIIVVKDKSITEENKNAYEYTIKDKEIKETKTIQVN